jgi:hypothetical protein
MLGNAGIDADGITRAGGGVWAFGSRAVGCSQPNSDWDVLVVSPDLHRPIRVRTELLDLVAIGLSSFLTEWRQSELATHVEAHGICLSADCQLKVVGQPLAAAPRKSMVVHQRAAMIDRLWDAFSSPRRRRTLIRLRRDLQRVALLEAGAAIPPGPLLDAAWAESTASERRRVIRSISLTPRVVREVLFGAEELAAPGTAGGDAAQNRCGRVSTARSL